MEGKVRYAFSLKLLGLPTTESCQISLCSMKDPPEFQSLQGGPQQCSGGVTKCPAPAVSSDLVYSPLAVIYYYLWTEASTHQSSTPPDKTTPDLMRPIKNIKRRRAEMILTLHVIPNRCNRRPYHPKSRLMIIGIPDPQFGPLRSEERKSTPLHQAVTHEEDMVLDAQVRMVKDVPDRSFRDVGRDDEEDVGRGAAGAPEDGVGTETGGRAAREGAMGKRTAGRG